MQNLIESDVYPMLLYDVETGLFYNKNTLKQYKLTDTLVLKLTNPVTKKQFTVKAIRAAWEMLNNKSLPRGLVLYTKNLDDCCLAATNIGAVDKETYKELREAVSNIKEHLKMKAHPNVPHYVVVQWKENKVLKSKVIHDVVSAKKFYRELLVKYTKILGKYMTTV